jgi:DNA-binding NarL/FixJ family response regulator
VVVLLVDEASGVRARLRERITREGTDVYEASDGPSAYAAVAASPVDVVVLDVHVRAAEPGLRMLACLRQSVPDALIIVLTNESSDLHRRECLSHGADHFFDKSHEFERAVTLVRGRQAGNGASHP